MLSINAKCRFLQGTYCALLCIALSFNTYYLETAGFSDRFIGIIIASSCAAGCIPQLAVGRLADTRPKFTWKNQLTGLSLMQIIVSTLLIFVHSPAVICILYMLMMFFTLPMMPLINRASFYYTEHGTPVDFGIARGIGSISFSAMSLIAGRFTVLWGSRMVPLLACVSAALFLTTLLTMPMMEDAAPKREKAEQRSSFAGLFSKYPTFIMSVLGIFLMLIFHNGINTYMIKIVTNVGGNSGSMGTALSIAAAAELPVMFLYGRIIKTGKIRNISLIIISGILIVLRGIFYLMASNVFAVFMIQILQGVTFGLLIASKASYASESMDAEDQSSGQSFAALAESLGTVCGSLTGGLLLDHAGVSAMLVVYTICAAVGTLITLIAAGKEKNPIRDS